MSVTEEPPAYTTPIPTATDADSDALAVNNASAAKPHDQTQTATAGDSPPKPVDISATADVAGDAATTTNSRLPEADLTLSQPTPSLNPFDSLAAEVEHTPELPPRPEPVEHEDEHTMAATTAVQGSLTTPTPGVDAAAQEERVSPQVEALRAMFPDFDITVLQSVLDSVDGDQERALDVLLGMSDPDYVSTQPVQQPEQSSMDLDEQLARQLMLEDQQQQQRHAGGTSWPRRGAGEVPYQARQQPHGSPPPGSDAAGERPDQFQELQRTMGQIAESGKRTFSSIVSRVKAKINEYEQTRNVNAGQGSAASTAPQWGAVPPAPLDRHTAQEAYQQQYFAASNAPAQPPASAAHGPSPMSGYDLDEPVVQSQPAAVASPIPTPASPPRGSADVPRPPPTNSGSPVNPAKIGLLPKRPVSLLNTSSPPATRPSDDDDELEYVENPFEEHK